MNEEIIRERRSNCFCDQLESDMYFGAVKTYYENHKDPKELYQYLVKLFEESGNLEDFKGMKNRKVDSIKITKDALYFYTEKCVPLALFPHKKKKQKL